MSEVTQSKPGFKFLWSHQGKLHRLVVRAANQLIGILPFRFRYWIALRLKKNKVPYSLVEGKTVVQVGAPFDTLEAGRSRGLYFSILAGEKGRVLIVEPLAQSVERFKERAESLKLENTTVYQSGAWSEVGTSVINVDIRHPATNYTGNTVDYSKERELQFEKVDIDLDTLDNIARKCNFTNVDLISITTNWAEEEILKGASGLLGNGVKYVCLAYGKDGEFYEKQMLALGYYVYSHDDRGVTFMRREAS